MIVGERARDTGSGRRTAKNEQHGVGLSRNDVAQETMVNIVVEAGPIRSKLD